MKKNTGQIYIGTMSGTSMDGLDLVAVEFNSTYPQILFNKTIEFPVEMRAALQSVAERSDATINEMCELDTLLGQFYANTINNFIDDNNIDRLNIAAIGSHGQTLRHNIQQKLPYTLQIGDPNIIAAKTDITVVADFRRRDVALGGQGAPFAPAFHNQIFRSDKVNRVIINIGGIANITFLPADSAAPVNGFDTGPGNTLLDATSKLYLQKNYDFNGVYARSGDIHTETLQSMLALEPYFRQNFPKSTGTHYFSTDWLKRFQPDNLSAADTLATLVELTAITISHGILSLKRKIDECFICGGGAHNQYLLERLNHHLYPAKVDTTLQLGIHPDWVEATAFAWLAKQTLLLLPGNIPSVTNAKTQTILGGVFFSHNYTSQFQQ